MRNVNLKAESIAELTFESFILTMRNVNKNSYFYFRFHDKVLY